MQPLDVDVRRFVTAEHTESLRADVRPAYHPTGRTRHTIGGLLVAAGGRLAPEALARATAHERPQKRFALRQ
jgi:hypothetical protein